MGDETNDCRQVSSGEKEEERNIYLFCTIVNNVFQLMIIKSLFTLTRLNYDNHESTLITN